LTRQLAQAFYQEGQFAKAESAYRKVLEQQPNDLMALNNLAYMLAEDMDKATEALVFAERAAEQVGSSDRAQASVLDTLGWIQFLADRTDEAEVTLRRSVRRQPMAANHLHLAKVLLSRDNTDEAREHLTEARRLATENNDQKHYLKQINQVLQTLDATAAGMQG
jgi:tetratricopeptide (TPR) repeat protein